MAGAASRETILRAPARLRALCGTGNLLLFGRKSMESGTSEPSLVMLGEWLKQLFDESEGKDHKGLFVTP